MVRPVPSEVVRLNFAAAFFIDRRTSVGNEFKDSKKDKKNAPVGVKHKKPVTSAPSKAADK
jgi:hypothetical protein